MAEDPKAVLQQYLRLGRVALLWKLEGLGERRLRTPLTDSGTNLLGIVKHVAGVELGYLGDVFGRPAGLELPWRAEGAEANADMWATPEESAEHIIDLYRRAAEHSDHTIAALPLDAVGHVPWWPEERRWASLQLVLVHVIAETHRHAGHADIVREQLDGARGMLRGRENLPPGDELWWADYVARLRRAAESFPDEA